METMSPYDEGYDCGYGDTKLTLTECLARCPYKQDSDHENYTLWIQGCKHGFIDWFAE